MVEPDKVAVPPGFLSPKEAFDPPYFLAQLVCLDCGTELDFWGRRAKDYHWPWCRYSHLAGPVSR